MPPEDDGPSRSTKSPNAFRTISEVAHELGLPQHVLRFWESKFAQVSPMKRAGGRRYYRPDDVALLSRIRDLLHHEGYTIKGVQKLLRQNGVKNLQKAPDVAKTGPAEEAPPKAPPGTEITDGIRAAVADLKGACGILRDAVKSA